MGTDCACVVFEGQEKTMEQRKRVELKKEVLKVKQAESERMGGIIVRTGKDGVDVERVERSA